MISHVLLGVTYQPRGHHQMFSRRTWASSDVTDRHNQQEQYIIASWMLFLRLFQEVLDFERFIQVWYNSVAVISWPPGMALSTGEQYVREKDGEFVKFRAHHLLWNFSRLRQFFTSTTRFLVFVQDIEFDLMWSVPHKHKKSHCNTKHNNIYFTNNIDRLIFYIRHTCGPIHEEEEEGAV